MFFRNFTFAVGMMKEKTKNGCDCLSFGEILRDLLEERGMSQKDLAADLNISASAVGNYVRNNREPDFDTLKKIAKYFHVSTDFLLNCQTEQYPNYEERKILQIFHALTEEQKDLYIEQGRVFIKCKKKKKEKSSPLKSANEAV